VQNHIEPARAKLLWGYDLPYLLTGMLNQHLRTAIKFKEAKLKGVEGTSSTSPTRSPGRNEVGLGRH
jgi:hypothetical protein